MEFPKRIDTHISESISFNVVSSVLPKKWIVREVTERDYGVDLYVELVNNDGSVTGDMVALQIKSTQTIKFNSRNLSTFSGVKKSTVNYWLGLPVPVFLIVVELKTGNVYWSSVEVNNREGKFVGNYQTASLSINKSNDFSKEGLSAFKLTYIREKRWPDIENAIEKSLMSYNSIGPLVLMCKRESDEGFCSTAIQFLLLQHYEYFSILFRYLHFGKPKQLPIWYERHIEYIKEKNLEPSMTFTYKIIKEMLQYFIWDYRDCIITSYNLVTENQKEYFSNRYPYLCAHLQTRPYAFILDDWVARYYYDEYENETKSPEKLFFKDFEEFDWIINDLTKT